MGLSDNEMEIDMLSYLPSKIDEELYHKSEKGRGRMNSALGATEGQGLGTIQLRLRGATMGDTTII